MYQKRSNKIDPVYHRKSAEITSMIRRIMEKGGEIALHGSRNSHVDSNELKQQLNFFESRLGFKFNGVRHHYLMFRHDTTFQAEADAGLLYDATLGFPDKPGFRNGMASPFFPFPISHDAGKLVEIPLHFMDGVFLHANEGSEAAKRKILEAYLYAKAAGGMFSLLVHPGMMDESEIPELSHFYHSFIPRCRLDRAHSMTAVELAHWWTAREKALRAVEYAPNAWRIKDVSIPEGMLFAVSAPNIRAMKFVIEGAKGAVDLDRDTLKFKPGHVSPETGITFIRKK
jgi:hypothetical protein